MQQPISEITDISILWGEKESGFMQIKVHLVSEEKIVFKVIQCLLILSPYLKLATIYG
jgi:hypothetical protein